jgi:hypothetical protein
MAFSNNRLGYTRSSYSLIDFSQTKSLNVNLEIVRSNNLTVSPKPSLSKQKKETYLDPNRGA